MDVTFDGLIKAFTALGGIGTFFWGVFQWDRNQKAQAEQKLLDAEKGREQRRLEAQKPFLSLQLALYTEAVEITSTIPIKMRNQAWQNGKEAELDGWIDRFWSLYFGKLAMVENKQVEAAMVGYGGILRKMVPQPPSAESEDEKQPVELMPGDEHLDELVKTPIDPIDELQFASLKLAKAVRISLDDSWNINVWTKK